MWIVFDEEENILLLKRVDRGNWEPVKWGMEELESPEATILRELHEETGLSEDAIVQKMYVWDRFHVEQKSGYELEVHRYVFTIKV